MSTMVQSIYMTISAVDDAEHCQAQWPKVTDFALRKYHLFQGHKNASYIHCLYFFLNLLQSDLFHLFTYFTEIALIKVFNDLHISKSDSFLSLFYCIFLQYMMLLLIPFFKICPLALHSMHFLSVHLWIFTVRILQRFLVLSSSVKYHQ